MTIKDAVKKYSKYLINVTHIPLKEVEIIIMHILDKNIIWLHLNYNLDFNNIEELEKLVLLRQTNYPIEYIINKVSFYGEQFFINKGVLIPRPETEILLENVLNIIKNENRHLKVIEIGTGSGVLSIMLAILIKDIEIIAVDINKDALMLAKKNAIKHKVEHKIEFILSDLYEEIFTKDIFLCMSNPPYIANNYILPKNVQYEPKSALFGGKLGDEILKQIIKTTYFRKIKYLVCEIGYDQKKSLKEYIDEFSIDFCDFYKDYENFDRGFIVKFKN